MNGTIKRQAQDGLNQLTSAVMHALYNARQVGRLTAGQIREQLDIPDALPPDGRQNMLIVGILMHLEKEELAESIRYKGWQLTELGIAQME